MFVYIWRVSNKLSQDLSKHTPVIAHTRSASDSPSVCAPILRTTTTSHVAPALHISSVAQTWGQYSSTDPTPPVPLLDIQHHPGLLLPGRTYLKSKRLSKLYRCGFRWHSNAEAPVAQPRESGDCDSKMFHSGQPGWNGALRWAWDWYPLPISHAYEQGQEL